MGRQLPVEPGTPVSEDAAFRPFWDTYHTITDRYAGGTRRPRGDHPGRHPRDDRALDDPYSSLPQLRRVPPTPRGHQRRVRGHRREIETKPPTGRQGCATLGPDCRLLIIAPIAGSPAEAAGILAGDLVLAADGVSLDGLTVDGARDRIRGPKGSAVDLSILRGDAEPFALEITRDVIQQEEVESARR